MSVREFVLVDLLRFNQDVLITALRSDQVGESTFAEFLATTSPRDVVRSEVTFARSGDVYEIS